MVIQRILRHANVCTTATCYIKTAADDVKQAMEKLKNNIPEAFQQPSFELSPTPSLSLTCPFHRRRILLQ